MMVALCSVNRPSPCRCPLATQVVLTGPFRICDLAIAGTLASMTTDRLFLVGILWALVLLGLLVFARCCDYRRGREPRCCCRH